jgi:hypothetical protein
LLARPSGAPPVKTSLSIVAVACAATLLGCASALPPYSQASLPDAVKVPAGHRVSWEVVGVGEITYECKAKAATPNAAAGFEWAFVGPRARLLDRRGGDAGSYSGPPAMWVAPDTGRITGVQQAIAPAAPGNIPLQLVKANPGSGSLAGTTFIQRVATRGGVAPALPCNAQTLGDQRDVPYQADYIFYKAG